VLAVCPYPADPRGQMQDDLRTGASCTVTCVPTKPWPPVTITAETI